jgi:hypothetical protein
MPVLSATSEALVESLGKSEKWMIQCTELLDYVPFTSSDRARLATSLFHVCIEHQTGFHVLADNGVFGSAVALFRPQFESFVRESWFLYCASEKQIKESITYATKQLLKNKLV